MASSVWWSALSWTRARRCPSPATARARAARMHPRLISGIGFFRGTCIGSPTLPSRRPTWRR
eukprot:3823598-Alexandrium_andersonii.AAC.1